MTSLNPRPRAYLYLFIYGSLALHDTVGQTVTACTVHTAGGTGHRAGNRQGPLWSQRWHTVLPRDHRAGDLEAIIFHLRAAFAQELWMPSRVSATRPGIFRDAARRKKKYKKEIKLQSSDTVGDTEIAWRHAVYAVSRGPGTSTNCHTLHVFIRIGLRNVNKRLRL